MEFVKTEVNDFSVPNIQHVTFKSIEKKYLRVIIANYVLLLMGYLVSLGVAFYILHIPFSDEFFVGIAFLIFLLLTSSFVLSLLSFSKRKYAVRTKDISYKKGLFTTNLTTVPFARVQHIEVKQGFISRKLQLANLEVYTAGESGGDLTIKGLKHQDANNIREFIMAAIDD